MFDMYRKKKPKVVDPNAPPRPNLLSHEKVLKDTKVTLEMLQQENRQMRQRIEALESKLQNQTAYFNYLHQALTSKKG
jgi:predicted RNase H-like nuclease (RuvC/YqgF family)